MHKTYRTEINPAPEQAQILRQAMGTCRFISNLYQNAIEKALENDESIPSASDFYKWINEEYLPANPDRKWILETHSKSRKEALRDRKKAWDRYFKGISRRPNYKKKNNSECSYYFVKNDSRTEIIACRHKIKVPGLGWVRLKEKAYIPSTDSSHVISSGRITRCNGRFYVSVLMKEPDKDNTVTLNPEGTGIDMGLKDLAVCSNGIIFPNINRSSRIKKLEKQLRHAQRVLSRKYESLMKRTGAKSLKKALKTPEFTHANIDKAVRRVQSLHARLKALRNDYLRKAASMIAKAKPSYVTVEHLAVKNLLKNRHLSRSISSQGWYTFKMYIIQACRKLGIEVREVSTFYPSSKTCHKCGHVHKGLKLKDRVYQCPKCGYTEDRDFNAALNLRDAKEYVLI